MQIMQMQGCKNSIRTMQRYSIGIMQIKQGTVMLYEQRADYADVWYCCKCSMQIMQRVCTALF
jgi:hypothetical protein